VRAATGGAYWEPLLWRYIASQVGDSYTNVRDNMAADEVEAWYAYLDAERKMSESRERAAKRRR
jgi:hypothetical protein